MFAIASLALTSVTLTLPVEAHVSGTELTVGALGLVESTDPALRERVSQLELGYAPAPGYSRLLLAWRLEQMVESRVPGVDLVVVGEAACRVWPVVQTIPSTDILDAALQELRLLAGVEDATFEPNGYVSPVQVPAGHAGVELRTRLTVDHLTSGVLAVPVRVLVDGTPYRTVWTSWTAEVWEDRPVLRQPVQAGQRLTPDLFTTTRVRRERPQTSGLAGELLAGSVAARDLAPGAVVGDLDVHRPMVLERGDSVFIQVRKGLVVARRQGLAMQAGAMGDRVRVQLEDSKHELTGRVVGRDLVEVALDQGF